MKGGLDNDVIIRFVKYKERILSDKNHEDITQLKITQNVRFPGHHDTAHPQISDVGDSL
jgi:hypothetical protein